MLALNLTGREVEVSEAGERRVRVSVGFGREREVRSVEYGVARLSFGFMMKWRYQNRNWYADVEMLQVINRSDGPGKTRAVSVELEPHQPACGFVVREDLKGFVYCTAAKLNIAMGSDLHVLLFSPSKSSPEVRAGKSVLTVSSEKAQAIAYLQHSNEGIEVSVNCNGEGIRSARLELLRSGSFSLGFRSELNASERLLTVGPGQSGGITWSPVNGPAEPVVVVTTAREISGTRKFQRLLSALGCKVRVGLFGGIKPEFGDLFVIGDHSPVRHSIELLLDVPRRPDVRDRTELEVIG